RGHGAAGAVARHGRGHQPLDRSAGGGRAESVPAAHTAGGAGLLLGLRGYGRLGAPPGFRFAALRRAGAGGRSMKRFGLFLFFGALCAYGQAPAPGGIAIRPLREFQLPPRIGVAGATRLTLDEVLTRVLENDADLRVTRISREQAKWQIQAAQGAYDPV